MRRQRGVALITAMLVVALAAITGAAMLSQMNIALHRSGNIWQSEQAWWYAVGVEQWLGQILREDAQRSDIDTLQEGWAQAVDYLPLDGGALQGQVVDLQGRFNLNTLGNGDAEAAMEHFERLIQRVVDTEVMAARTIAAATRDWIDADINPTVPNGAEDNHYLGLSPAYRTGNTAMVSPSELRLVRGVTPELYAALAPYISALPSATPINVNTAPAPILGTLAPDLPPDTGAALVEERADQPWETVQAFLQEDAIAGREIDANRLSVATGYFLATGRISVGRARLDFYSVLERADNGVTHVIAHSTHAY